MTGGQQGNPDAREDETVVIGPSPPSTPESFYPSGAPRPFYGPRTTDEWITDGLEWAVDMLIRRDQMNASVHCGPVRWSPVTTAVRIALDKHRHRLTVREVCEGCYHGADECRPLRAEQRKCCPDCTHGTEDGS